MFFFILVPLLNGFRLSFFKWNGYSQNMKFIWFDNYVKLPDDKYLRLAFLNTLLYGFGSTILQNILGLTAALFVDSRFRGHTFVRTFIYMPIMIANLIMGYIMYYFLQYEGGIINEVMGWFGRAPVDWLSDAGRARIIITLVNSVQYCGNSMVLYLALKPSSSAWTSAALLRSPISLDSSSEPPPPSFFPFWRDSSRVSAVSLAAARLGMYLS